MKNEKGETITSRKGIANVFGKFYRKMYARKSREKEPRNMETKMDNEKKTTAKAWFTEEEEVQAAIDKLKKGKASDNNGIRAEDEVLKQDECTPETWRSV